MILTPLPEGFGSTLAFCAFSHAAICLGCVSAESKFKLTAAVVKEAVDQGAVVKLQLDTCYLTSWVCFLPFVYVICPAFKSTMPLLRWLLLPAAGSLQSKLTAAVVKQAVNQNSLVKLL